MTAEMPTRISPFSARRGPLRLSPCRHDDTMTGEVGPYDPRSSGGADDAFLREPSLDNRPVDFRKKAPMYWSRSVALWSRMYACSQTCNTSSSLKPAGTPSWRRVLQWFVRWSVTGSLRSDGGPDTSRDASMYVGLNGHNSPRPDSPSSVLIFTRMLSSASTARPRDTVQPCQRAHSHRRAPSAEQDVRPGSRPDRTRPGVRGLADSR
jgi:hypothetical protein